MQIFSKSDVGAVRSSNQDAFFAAGIGNDAAVVVVCDGMGGANAGNVASQTAVKTISDYIVRSFSPSLTEEKIEKLLKNSIESANIEIYDMAQKNQNLSGMGTTVVAAIVIGGRAVIAHVGDSRAYLVGSEAVQLTRDHSVVQSLVESGKITPEDAKFHPRKNVITRALGVEEGVVADICNTDISDDKTLLICTDGLTGFVDIKAIAEKVNNPGGQLCVEQLVELANKNGGGDNITVVTVKK